MIRAESSCRNRWVREGKELTLADMEVDATNDPLLAVGFADAVKSHSAGCIIVRSVPSVACATAKKR